MFSNLFKPRWQHKNPETRISAINNFNLNDATHCAHLEHIIQHDDNELVREAAIQKINSLAFLIKIASLSKERDRKKIIKKIIEEISNSQISAQEMIALTQQHPALPLTHLFAEHHPNENTLLEWVDSLPIETTLNIANVCKFNAVKNKVLHSINDEETLKKLAKQSDKLDKRSNQLVREKLKSLREENDIKKNEQNLLEKLIFRLETLAKAENNTLYNKELFELREAWKHTAKQLKNSHPELMNAGTLALSTCEAKANASQNIDIAVDTTTPETRKNEPVETFDIPSTVDDIQANNEKTHDDSTLPAPTVQNQLHDKSQESLNIIHKTLPLLDQALEEKNLTSAKHIAHTIQIRLKDLTPEHYKSISQRFVLLQNQINELQDWLEFSTLPKLEALCEKMEQLITTTLPPPQKANAIKDLQQQWKSNKIPNNTTAKELWNRFKTASDTAYAPCITYFAKEKELRSHNLSQRISICESLEAYYQALWGDNTAEPPTINVDWKALHAIITTAKKEFHTFHPVERHEEPVIKARFHKAVEKLNAELVAEQQRNEAKKQQLIDRAKLLLESNEPAKAITSIKDLQTEWKTIGHGRKHQDQKLWDDFHKTCNTLFEKRQQEREKNIQAENAKIAESENLCIKIKTLMTSSVQDIAHLTLQFHALKDQFNELHQHEKPKPAVYRLFIDACHAFEKHLQHLKACEKQREWEHFIQLADLCKQLEYRPTETQIEDIIMRWNNTSVPHPYRSLLTSRYQHALSVAKNHADIDFTENEQIRKRICIQLEILMGKETPAEDLNLRNEYQIQTLKTHFGKGENHLNQQKEELIHQWYSCGAASPQAQAILEERFHRITTS